MPGEQGILEETGEPLSVPSVLRLNLCYLNLFFRYHGQNCIPPLLIYYSDVQQATFGWRNYHLLLNPEYGIIRDKV